MSKIKTAIGWSLVILWLLVFFGLGLNDSSKMDRTLFWILIAFVSLPIVLFWIFLATRKK
jgi:hypothetical protein